MKNIQALYRMLVAPVVGQKINQKVTSTRPQIIRKLQNRELPVEYLRRCYQDHKALWQSKKLPEDVDSKAVFTNNELDLRSIKVYGFDYDYTLANYDPAVEHLIYNLGKKVLISKFKYPEPIKNLEYDREFAVRGLHYDIENGYLMKIDQFQQIQMGSIYKGLSPIAYEEVKETYGARALPLDFVEAHLRGKTKMAHLADLFSLPEMCLLSQVAQYFIDNEIPYHSISLFNDVKSAIGSVHPEMHRVVGQNIGQYLVRDKNLLPFFKRLKDHDKQIFIITNSPFHFVDSGMSYILGENWRDYFDVVVANAKKPDFFSDKMRPFRELNTEIHTQAWDPVNQLQKGKIYLEGNLSELQRLKNWHGEEVMYFGDHPYSDLADVSLHHNWRTGAIIWELDYEIQCLNSIIFKQSSGWLQILQSLIESCQDYDDPESRKIILEWETERDNLRKETKKLFNKHFGSVFRTHDNPTYFSRRLFRFADIYTSKLSNLMDYSINHTYYPRRGVLPHEYKALFV